MGTADQVAALVERGNGVRDALLVAPDGAVEAATTTSARADRLASAAAVLVERASLVRPSAGAPSRIEVTLDNGSVFVVREGERTAVALTVPEPVAGLVVHDLRTLLEETASQPKRRRSAKSADA